MVPRTTTRTSSFPWRCIRVVVPPCGRTRRSWCSASLLEWRRLSSCPVSRYSFPDHEQPASNHRRFCSNIIRTSRSPTRPRTQVCPQLGDNDDRDEGVSYLACRSDFIHDGIPAVRGPRRAWTASSRGLCLVTRIYADLIGPDLSGGFFGVCSVYQHGYGVFDLFHYDGRWGCVLCTKQPWNPKVSFKKTLFHKKKRLRRIRSAMKSKSVLQKNTIPSEEEWMN